MDLINKAKQILLAGSSVATASKPRAFFGSRKPARAQEFIKNVRLGQTERGSYIVKVISPLPLELEDKNLTLPSIPEKTPFERLAVESTFRGMIALNDVVAEIEKKGKFYFDPFLERVIDGVNADLCEAIIGKKEHEQLPLNFSVAWSPAFKIDISSDLTERVYFSANSYQYIREAAEQFRRIEPEEVSIIGYVIKLHKESKVGDGDITLATTISGKNRKITIYLESVEYRKATEAHDKWLEVEATGILEKGKLVSVTSFSLLNGMFD
ncbi:hypothetical protein [Leucothrix pacifica]|uniref:hypothetical protein n=1 Tax=Leucothrix pacifica TaxID=1247513 RepID=UPI000D6DEC95|nr:hypothetical protein [Leucothrix pacifica]